jgi:H+-transporting ATPase
MADPTAAGATGPKTTDGAPHIDTNIESGKFDEKAEGAHNAPPKGKPLEEEEEDEDMDALIDELESEDGHAEEEEEEEHDPATGRVIPEDQLQTDTRTGLTEQEVVARRKKYGLNQMKEEKENLILKFLGYFVGPIQFVMEVSSHFSICTLPSFISQS